MKITRVDAFALRFPEGDAFGGHAAAGAAGSDYALQPGWRGIYSRRIESMVVRIETDTGVVGWGEGQSPIAPDVSATLVELLLRPVLIGSDPLGILPLHREMMNLMNLRGHAGSFMMDAIAGADIALWDIKGKALGVPVHALLGGPARREVPCYVSGLRGEDDDRKLDNLREFASRGFNRFKLFGGFGIAADAALMNRLIDAAGPHGEVAFDALWRYGRSEAQTLGRRLEAMGCAWFEAPVDPEDVAGHAELARMLTMPVAGGETERTRRQFAPWLTAGAFDLIQPDIGRCGITEGMRIIDLAEHHHLPVALHCGIASPVMIAATIQVALAHPHVTLAEYQPVVVAAANRLLDSPIRCEGGAFPAPVGPGLGICVDEGAIRRLAGR